MGVAGQRREQHRQQRHHPSLAVMIERSRSLDRTSGGASGSDANQRRQDGGLRQGRAGGWLRRLPKEDLEVVQWLWVGGGGGWGAGVLGGGRGTAQAG
jgi:hypothetical protein